VHVDVAALTASIGRLQRLEVGGNEVGDTLQQVVMAADRLVGTGGSGLMLIDESETLRYVAASDDTGRALESAQADAGEGPCVDAFVHDNAVSTDDIEDDDRWPVVTPIVRSHGIRAVLGVPVHLGGGPVGSLNVYASAPHGWDDSEIAAMRAFSAIIEALLAGSVRSQQTSAIVDQLQYALDNRVVIERAIGLLMGRAGLDRSAAFERLRRTARDQRRRVGEVAEELLARP
jgi:GAF domain-containing protein